MGASLSAKLLFIGLDNAGKTSFLTFLEEGPHSHDTKPSVGFDTKEVKFKGVDFSIYDVAGKEKVRDLWKHYYESTDAIIWIVDASDPDRFEESRQALELALKDPTMKKDIPIIVAANKCDLKGAQSEEDIKKAFKLEELLKGRNWKTISTNAKKGDGIMEGFKWMSQELKTQAKQKKKTAK